MRQKKFLLVDDDAGFLAVIHELFVASGGGKWEVFTATNHAQALEILQKDRIDLIVLDIGMPIMDGFQFLRLLNQTHPGQHVAMLTGDVTEEKRKSCAQSGVLLLLEKPVNAEGFTTLFAALDSLAEAQVKSGFRGMMRQVGLQEVLQMECLGRKSSVLEVFAGKVRGRIYISDGSIVHAESGPVGGEAALYGLLALQGGEFNLGPFTEPSQRTIQGQWEFLLMEAARLSDEGSLQPLEPPETPVVESQAEAAAAPEPPVQAPSIQPAIARIPEPALSSIAVDEIAPAPGAVQIAEVVLCSGSGEVLYEWECPALENRLRLMQQVEQQASQVSNAITVGLFNRVEILTGQERIVCHLQPDRRLLVRSINLPHPDA